MSDNDVKPYDGPALGEVDRIERLAQMLHASCTRPEWATRPGDIVRLIVDASGLNIPVGSALDNIIYTPDGGQILRGRLVLALVRRAGYGVKVIRSDDKAAIIVLTRGGAPVGAGSWTIHEAMQAGLTENPIWSAYASDSLFWRAVGRAARRHASGAIVGLLLEEAMDESPSWLSVDDDGMIVIDGAVSATLSSVIVTDPDDGMPAPADDATREHLAECWKQIASTGKLDEPAGEYGEQTLTAREVIRIAAGRLTTMEPESGSETGPEPQEPESDDTGSDDDTGDAGFDRVLECGCSVEGILDHGGHQCGAGRQLAAVPV